MGYGSNIARHTMEYVSNPFSNLKQAGLRLFAVPYPFLTTNELPVRIQIYAGATTFAYLVFQLLNSLHG